MHKSKVPSEQVVLALASCVLCACGDFWGPEKHPECRNSALRYPHCTVDASTPVVDAGAHPQADGGPAADSGAKDAGHDAAVRPCAAGCSGAKAVCNASTNTCVECTQTSHAACTGGTPVCNASTASCVQCTTSDTAACTGSTPICNPTTNTCVQCTTSDTAACTGSTPVCNASTAACVQCTASDATACTGSTPVCDSTTNTCVACNTNAECNGASKSVCTNHACTACVQDADCSQFGGKNVCDSGQCVQCTIAKESKCNGDSCNPATKTCTGTLIASRNVCEGCVADSECKTNYRCVPMTYNGTPRTGGYCLKTRGSAGGCAQPYATTVVGSSLSGAASDTYCGVDETRTTCEATIAMIAARTCTGASDCTTTGLTDALCQTVSGIANKCTYACDTSLQCPNSTPCGTTDKYCGGQ